ncbi:hypothetical protein JOB18_003874 [Solea senegalensis]|nr:hypothetical protein JOB18_003874 [Solea senegalensis]
MEECVYLRFDSYDFDSDQRFKDGLKILHHNNNNSDGNRLKDMKLFFYNRFVEPIDQSGYKQWSSASPPLTQMDSRVQQQDQETPSERDCETSKNQASETSAETEVTQLSFAEVMRLIQEGKEVPGAIKLDIKPSNQSATPSQMERILKPWENASSSK